MRNKKGFTLVEVIISIAVLGIICAVMLRLFVLAGNTSSRASEIQSAQVCVISAVETLQSADTLSSGIGKLGLNCREDVSGGDFSYSQSGFDVYISVSETGGYPGTLCDISVSAFREGRLMSSIETKKYYREQRNE